MAKTSSLPPEERAAIRQIAEKGHARGYRGTTLARLQARGLVPETGGPHRLTEKGQQEYKRIMASGDGPEDLKEMFRF